jgi:hypothetical protein
MPTPRPPRSTRTTNRQKARQTPWTAPSHDRGWSCTQTRPRSSLPLTHIAGVAARAGALQYQTAWRSCTSCHARWCRPVRHPPRGLVVQIARGRRDLGVPTQVWTSMKKVEGSNPVIRLREAPAQARLSRPQAAWRRGFSRNFSRQEVSGCQLRSSRARRRHRQTTASPLPGYRPRRHHRTSS